MPLYLHTIKSSSAKKKKPRVGRGGKRGTYSGRGGKGQTARSGGRSHLKRKGLRQLMEQTHKLRGFKTHQPRPAVIDVGKLAQSFKDNDKITLTVLKKRKLIRGTANSVKILGSGEIKTKLIVVGCSLSKKAQEVIEKAGGTIQAK